VSVARRLGAAFGAASVTSAVRGALDWQPPGGAPTWTRTNHRGEPVSLLEGPSLALGVLAGALVGAGGARATAAAAVAVAGSGAFGLVDDLREDTSTRTKGLRGHLGALAHGRLTTGGLKVLGIGASALAAAALAPPAGGAAARPVVRVADTLASTALVAGTANLVNLLDLRPGRALKASALVAAPLVATPGGGVAAAVLGAASSAVEADLAETDMLGDSGANALGAALGTALVLGAPRRVRLGALAVVVGLTLASERVSFTRVIERTPVLRELDAWGRRPAHVPAAAGRAAGRDAA
jgi:UDP-N-acetylmuramyl pentapeptide phosphotransferase/UDP-N-acetylglucosamine-1-phosphate transferase